MCTPVTLQEQKGRTHGLGLERWRQLGEASPGKCYSEIYSCSGKECMRYIQTISFLFSPEKRKNDDVKLRQGCCCPLSLTPPCWKVQQWLLNERNKGTRPLILGIKRELVSGKLKYLLLDDIKELFILLGMIWWLRIFLMSFFSVRDAEFTFHSSSSRTIGLQ